MKPTPDGIRIRIRIRGYGTLSLPTRVHTTSDYAVVRCHNGGPSHMSSSDADKGVGGVASCRSATPAMEDVADGMEDAGGGDSDYPQEEKEGGRVGRRAQNPGSARRRASVDRRRA